MKKTYLSRDFRETAAQRFPAQAKELNAAFDARLNALLAENAGAGKEKQYHLKRQILPGIAACGYDEVSLSRHLHRIRLPGAVPLLLRQRRHQLYRAASEADLGEKHDAGTRQ